MTHSELRAELLGILTVLPPELSPQRQQLLDLFKKIKVPEVQVVEKVVQDTGLITENKNLKTELSVLNIKLTSANLKLEEKQKSKEEYIFEEQENTAYSTMLGAIIPFYYGFLEKEKFSDKLIWRVFSCWYNTSRKNCPMEVIRSMLASFLQKDHEDEVLNKVCHRIDKVISREADLFQGTRENAQ